MSECMAEQRRIELARLHAEVERLTRELAEYRRGQVTMRHVDDQVIDGLRAEVERYQQAIETHRANVWGFPVTREVGHPEDAKLYAALRGGEGER